MSDDKPYTWPVTDAEINKAELDAMDGVDISYLPSGPHSYGPLAIGPTDWDETMTVDNHTMEVKGDLVISDADGSNSVDVGENLKTLNERLLVLTPNFEAMEEYPALKDAYDQYKMLEKLLMENKDGKNG